MTTGTLMVIQFSGPLSAQDISELRTVHRLRLDAYQPERSYLERIDADQKRRLERDPRVIAVRPYSAATQRGRQPARASAWSATTIGPPCSTMPTRRISSAP